MFPARSVIAIALSVYVLCGAPAKADPASTQAIDLASDIQERTPAGTTFTLAKAWSLETHGQVLVAVAPEGDLRLAIVDLDAGSYAADAITRAWALYRPDFRRQPRVILDQPANGGWEASKDATYETSPNERAVFDAVAERKGAHWTVVITDGAAATFNKRGAAVDLMISSLAPAGYVPETFAGRQAHQLNAERVEALKRFVQTSMTALKIPGVALALVDHGEVVFEGGFGVRELGRTEAVDAHTRFMIASNTKGLTTLLLARLVDAGKFDWDTPVTKVYPDFHLGSPEATEKVLIRHLVCACTGLPRRDREWIFNTPRGTPASRTFSLLARTEPTSGFGEVYQYNNLMASAAGYIGAHVLHPDLGLGEAYDKAMQEMIFNPLAMNDTTFSFSDALASDHASPHAADLDGQPAQAQLDFDRSVVPYRPQGGAWSSAHDMIRYVQDELTQGVLPGGRRLVSAKNLLMRRAHGVQIGYNSWYGMGLENHIDSGVTVIRHGGSLLGFKSDIYVLPDAQVGAVLLTNADRGQGLLDPFLRRLLEVLYDGKPEAEAEVVSNAAGYDIALAKDRQGWVIPPASEVSNALAQRYVNPDLGHIDVRRNGERIEFDFGGWKSEIASRSNEDGTNSFITIDPGLRGFVFIVTARDGKRALVMRDSQHEYAYVEEK